MRGVCCRQFDPTDRWKKRGASPWTGVPTFRSNTWSTLTGTVQLLHMCRCFWGPNGNLEESSSQDWEKGSRSITAHGGAKTRQRRCLPDRSIPMQIIKLAQMDRNALSTSHARTKTNRLVYEKVYKATHNAIVFHPSKGNLVRWHRNPSLHWIENWLVEGWTWSNTHLSHLPTSQVPISI